MKHRAMYDKGSLATELAGLPSLGRDELLERWHILYKTQPPVRISTELLIMAVAYKMQEQVYGGLKPATRKFLAKAAEELRAGGKVSAPAPVIKSGTRLIREWNGRTYEAEVTADGVLFHGKQYRSLSEVARIITGTKWSGPLFFGLKKRGEGA